jgi:hypothetical protein
MEWARILAYITGTVDEELLLRNEYLAAENRILRGQLKGRLKLSDAERAKLGEIGRRLGRKALGEVATAALPDTILAWYRRLVARKFDGSQKRRSPGRPRINREVEELIVRMAEENRSWGYDRIVGALAELFRHSKTTMSKIIPLKTRTDEYARAETDRKRRLTPFRFLDLRLTVRISRGAISWQAMVTIRDQSRTILGTRISSIPCAIPSCRRRVSRISGATRSRLSYSYRRHDLQTG